MSLHFETRRNWLIDQVNASDNLNDLVALLSVVPIRKVKTLIKEEIETLSNDQASKAYYDTTSLIDIFPTDITKHILSFNVVKDIHSMFNPICKTFYSCSKNNEEMYIKQLTKIIH